MLWEKGYASVQPGGDPSSEQVLTYLCVFTWRPPVIRQTDTIENITLPQLSMRMVNITRCRFENNSVLSCLVVCGHLLMYYSLCC